MAPNQMDSLDRYDRALLEALQEDSSLSMAALSERIGLSTTPCWKRVKRLDDEATSKDGWPSSTARKSGSG